MTPRKVRLIDIAGKLDVSVGLVSNVLRGRSKELKISDELSRKVIDTARAMGYRPNQNARGLRTGRSGLIGLAVGDISNPFFSKMARHIENEAVRLGYQVVFGSSDEDPEKLEDLVHTFLSRQVDGMIIVPVLQSDEFLRSLQDQAVPYVFIDRYLEGLEADSIVTDNYQGAYQLTRQLCNRGHPVVAAFATLPGLSSVKDRIRGYRAALKDAGIDGAENSSPQEEGWVINVDFQQSGQGFDHLLEEVLHKGCRAFFFTNNKLAISSLKYFRQKSLSLPEDVDIVSFDNTETFQVLQPCIPCLEQPIEEMAARAMKVLSRKIEGNKYSGPEQITLPGTLISPDGCW